MAALSPKSTSPLPSSPGRGNANSVFFSGRHSDLSTVIDRALIIGGSRSPSPNRANISIKIDPAPEDTPTHDARHGGRASPNMNRSSSKDNFLERDQARYRHKYIARSYEYDRELIRRQQVMIAIQPMTGLEEIEYKRDLLRMKVENRRRAEMWASKRASTTLGTLSVKSNPTSRSVSPAPSPDIGTSEYRISKKLADSTSQAIKVTKKVINSSNKVTPPPISKVRSKLTVKPKK